MLLDDLKALTSLHLARCPPYRRIVERMFPDHERATSLADLPFLPVSLFKSHELASVPADKIHMVLTSSGTTGQRVSRIVVDTETADRQSRALAAVMASVLGPKRIPMLILDIRSLFKDPHHMSARGAGVLGMMRFGRAHCWALDESMRLDEAPVREFLEKHGREPFLMFGFTFMAWKYFLKPAADLGLDLSNGTLVHSGGWKKLIDEAVDNATFRRFAKTALCLERIYNFYGMVEQIGSVFMEGDNGALYPPNFAEIIIRDPRTWESAVVGTPGVIQVLSILPQSYPGHSLLTEDLGVLQADTGGPWRGHSLTVLGRAPASELRGCSDVHAFAAGTMS
jgi:hypothetical protein